MVEKIPEVAPGGIGTTSLRLPWPAVTVKAVRATPVEGEGEQRI